MSKIQIDGKNVVERQEVFAAKKNGLRFWSLMKQNSSKLCKTFCNHSSSDKSMQTIASTYFLFLISVSKFSYRKEGV